MSLPPVWDPFSQAIREPSCIDDNQPDQPVFEFVRADALQRQNFARLDSRPVGCFEV